MRINQKVVWVLALVVIAVVLALAVGTPYAAADDEVQAKINRLIKQMGDNDWRKREDAHKELLKMGFDKATRQMVLEAVKKAFKDKDVEIRIRAKIIFNRIAPKVCVVSSAGITVINRITNKVLGTIELPSPQRMVVTPDGKKAYVVLRDGISIIDLMTHKEVKRIIGSRTILSAIAITPDGKKVYVANWRSNTVSVIDTTNNKVTKIKVDDPGAMAITPDGKKVYVANKGDKTVSVIDTKNNKVTKIKVDDPEAMAITPDGKKVYVTTWPSNTVSVIDTKNNKVTKIKVDDPEAMAITPDGKKVYVTTWPSNTVSVIDTKNNKVTKIKAGNPEAMAITPDSKKVYVANGSDGTVSVINTKNNKVTKIKVGDTPSAIAITPDGSKVYVGKTDGTMSIIDTKTDTEKDMDGDAKNGVQPIKIPWSPGSSHGVIIGAVPTSVEDSDLLAADIMIHPELSYQDERLWVALYGINTNMEEGLSVIDFGPGIRVESFVVHNPIEAEAYIAIDPEAALGPRDVTVTTGEEAITLEDVFMVPALSEWGAIILGVLLAGSLAWMMRKKGLGNIGA